MDNPLPKIIAVLGPTASGKSDVAVSLALDFSGEVVSADSRQVYHGLDVATGKITKEETKGIPHHLLDITNPDERYSVSEYKSDAERAIDEILARKNLPIICGGTMLYIDAVTENIVHPEILPDENLREELNKKSVDELFAELEKIDPRRAVAIDRKNPRRLVRALEVARALGAVPEIAPNEKKYNTLKIGIFTEKEILRERIQKRVTKRFQLGMVDEAKALHSDGLSFERMRDLGLEYRFLADYLENKISLEELSYEIFFKDWQYAKRQMTWLKRDPAIHWLGFAEKEKQESLVRDFLK